MTQNNASHMPQIFLISTISGVLNAQLEDGCSINKYKSWRCLATGIYVWGGDVQNEFNCCALSKR